MSDFSVKMYQIQFRLTALPDSLARFWEKGRERRKGRRKEKGREGVGDRVGKREGAEGRKKGEGKGGWERVRGKWNLLHKAERR